MIGDQKLNVFRRSLGPQILSQAAWGLLVTALNYSKLGIIGTYNTQFTVRNTSGWKTLNSLKL
jgi:hypothetical protein